MAAFGRRFKGTPDDTALMQPWIGPALPGYHGIPIGIDLRTGAIVLMDPWWMKTQKYINSTVFGFIGDKDFGKSTLIKSMLTRYNGRHAGIDPLTGEPEKMRMFINDQKPEDGNPEYADVSRFLCSVPYSLNQPNLVNIFDPKFFRKEDPKRPFHLLELTQSILEEIYGHGLRDLEPFVLQVAISKMCRLHSATTSPEMLRDILINHDHADVKSYYEQSRDQLLKTFAEEIKEDESLETRMHFSTAAEEKYSIDARAYGAACAQVAIYVDRILTEFGGIFGGNRSLMDILSERLVTFDWSGIDEKTRTTLSGLFWRLRRAALENNHIEIIPHMEVRDENHEDRFNMMQVRYESSVLKKARAYHTLQIRASQHIHDYLEAGDEGSERRGLMQGIVRSFAGWFVCHQPRDKKTSAALREIGFSLHDIDYLTNEIDIGCHAFIVPGKQPIFFQNLLTPSELGIVQTNRAAERMTEIPARVMTVGAIQRQARNFGVITIGEEN